MQTKRKLQIIDESINLIAEKGITGFSIKSLSKSIGISEQSIYLHFENKTDILLDILNYFKEMTILMKVMASESNHSAMDKISYLFEKIIDIIDETPAILTIIFSDEILKNEKTLKNKIIEVIDTNGKILENIIQEGQNKNEIRNDINAKILTIFFLGALRFQIKRWDLCNYNFNLKEEVTILILSFKTILSRNN
jgi:AcrR family transcriptional regulator